MKSFGILSILRNMFCLWVWVWIGIEIEQEPKRGEHRNWLEMSNDESYYMSWGILNADQLKFDILSLVTYHFLWLKLFNLGWRIEHIYFNIWLEFWEVMILLEYWGLLLCWTLNTLSHVQPWEYWHMLFRSYEYLFFHLGYEDNYFTSRSHYG